MLFIAAIFLVSLVPFLLTLKPVLRDAELVQELRPLAPFPSSWQGGAMDVDKNYARFEKWFADHVGLRNLMIRAKNEIDYRLFRSSRRVYFGADDQLFGRSIADIELPATERLLDTPQKIEAVYQGVVRFSEKLRAQGITPIFLAPIQKQYFSGDRLPFFAPRLPDASNFMKLYERLNTSSEIHFVDVLGIIRSKQSEFPAYYRQDFHWTDLTAHAVAAATTDRIALLEGAKRGWRHPLEIQYEPFVGSEARFSALLSSTALQEPMLKKTWTERHRLQQLDPKSTGLEFETGALEGDDLLPPTCMFGNSFSDGMLRAGTVEHFRTFTKIDRALPLQEVPRLIQNKCKYLIVQVLDIQTGHWLSLTK
ncbi:MAG TPA: hypothetical protein VGE12_08245 [Noviherbaspirillum sp.]